MADDTTASVISLHQVPRKRKDRSGAARSKASRQRRRQAGKVIPVSDIASSDTLIPPEFLPADNGFAEVQEARLLGVSTPTHPSDPATCPPAAAYTGSGPSSPRSFAQVFLTVAALALGAVGIIINGWFARSLGSSDVAGWLFLAVGIAADLVALVMPSCSAAQWQAGLWPTALVGWTVWLMTFVFAVTAGIGFASTNIADVTLARASRMTPAVLTAQTALADAMAARDRECKGGIGRFCREREAAVAERRQIVDSAMATVGQAADPQADAAIKLVTWLSRGVLHPAAEDFAMLRLIMLALLPQIGGILIMVGRGTRPVLRHR